MSIMRSILSASVILSMLCGWQASKPTAFSQNSLVKFEAKYSVIHPAKSTNSQKSVVLYWSEALTLVEAEELVRRGSSFYILPESLQLEQKRLSIAEEVSSLTLAENKVKAQNLALQFFNPRSPPNIA